MYDTASEPRAPHESSEPSLEFLEQFNEKVLVKQEGRDVLKVIDLITQESYEIKGFQTP